MWRFGYKHNYFEEEQKFEDSLEKLTDKMLLLGHNDYVDVCDEIAMLLDKKVKERKR